MKFVTFYFLPFPKDWKKIYKKSSSKQKILQFSTTYFSWFFLRWVTVRDLPNSVTSFQIFKFRNICQNIAVSTKSFQELSSFSDWLTDKFYDHVLFSNYLVLFWISNLKVAKYLKNILFGGNFMLKVVIGWNFN